MTEEEYELDDTEFEEAKALAIIESKLSTTNEGVTSARIPNPVESVEKSLAVFAKDSFAVVREDYEFHQKIQDEVIHRLDRFTENQLIALLSNDSVNLNDRVSKVMAPTFSLITSKQQAEIAARTQQEKMGPGGVSSSTNIKEINQALDADLLNGLKAFNDLMSTLSSSSIKQRTANDIEQAAGPDTRTVKPDGE